MNAFLKATALFPLLMVLTSCHKATPPELDAFRRLPGDRSAAWQVDVASLRRGLLPLPAELSGVERVSGVIAGNHHAYAIFEPGAAPAKLAPPPGSAGNAPDISTVPAGAQFWMVAEPRAFATNSGTITLTFGKTTIDLPGELVSRATQLTASGHAGAAGMDLTIDTEYSDAADPARLAPSVAGVLKLARGIDTQVAAQGNHIVIHGKVGAAEAGKLLWNWMAKE